MTHVHYVLSGMCQSYRGYAKCIFTIHLYWAISSNCSDINSTCN